MAKNLKVGDFVTVTTAISFAKTSEPFTQGLKSVNPGDIGKLVNTSGSRSAYVDFNGVQALISKQKLTVAEPPAKKRGRPKGVKQDLEVSPETVSEPNAEEDTPTTTVQVEVEPTPVAKRIETTSKPAPNSANKQLLNFFANKMLSTGKIKSTEETTVEIRLAELPEELRSQIESLIEAKLALGVEDLEPMPTKIVVATPTVKATEVKRGRKAKQQAQS